MRRTLAALALAMTPPLAVLQVPSVLAQQVVVVRSGETLSEIAERHGVSLTRLMQANGIQDADLVVEGQRLTIPSGGSSAPAAAATSRTTQGTAPYTVKSGETLSEIATRFNTTTERLIQINAIRNPDLVMSGTRLQVPRPAQKSTPSPAAAPAATAVNRDASTHVVQPGESLSLIAEQYGTSVSRLVALNQLEDPELVMAGTRLKLRGTPPPPRSAPQPAAQPRPRPPAAAAPAAAAATPKAPTQRPAAASKPAPAQASPVQTAAVQAQTTASPLPTAQPATAQAASPQPAPVQTATSQPASPQAATPQPAASRPAAAEPAQPVQAQARSTSTPSRVSASPATTAPAAATALTPAATQAKSTSVAAKPTPARPAGDWRNYGPLQVDWSKIQPMGGSYVAPSLNSDGQALYLAVNCTARKINVTSQAGQWRTWETPSKDFEYKLVEDICQANRS
jgi:LysM repeat protein